MKLRVWHLERLDGTHPSVRELAASWVREGTHDVLVAPDGGLRTDEAGQADKAKAGLSAAASLKSTPHGRGAAGDFWPVSFLPFVPVSAGGMGPRWVAWEKLPQQVRDEFRAFGEFAEKRGFRWGGRWVSKLFPNGDQPHVEMPQWGALPFPPPKYS